MLFEMLLGIPNTQVDNYVQPFVESGYNARIERDVRYSTYLNTEIKEKYNITAYSNTEIKEKYNITAYLNMIMENEIINAINIIQKEFKYKINSWEIFENNETKKVDVIFNTDLSDDITSDKIYEINKQIYDLFSLSKNKYIIIDSLLVV
ncbi:hypothetical protein ACMXEJ_001762 [Campylobacter jejuni]|uniref:hypothetical protein n=1 Tax=Campylobacter jejuni TaxID=197 RepID=UPI000F80F297|nr:hypothetical protein [Campylobacter jejuni]RTK00893.1 hypothetical protein C3H41_09240 [Campylobacter jejuni]HEF7702245.1 hypothetical protein [Campylobacter jejuni]HEF7707431.1 hypothetical protein [Campylobacter jejuni]HEF8756724.1 hypothetical protein [Campylobacter jejuni]